MIGIRRVSQTSYQNDQCEHLLDFWALKLSPLVDCTDHREAPELMLLLGGFQLLVLT